MVVPIALPHPSIVVVTDFPEVTELGWNSAPATTCGGVWLRVIPSRLH
jgi:hypothetical protein